MKTDIQNIGFSPRDEVTDLLNHQLNKVTRYHHNIVATDVYMKYDSKLNDKRCNVELRFELPGPNVFIKADGGEFPEAIHKAFDHAKIQLIKAAEKMKERR